MTRNERLELSKPYTLRRGKEQAIAHTIGGLLAIPTMGASLALINVPTFIWFMNDAISYNTKHQRY